MKHQKVAIIGAGITGLTAAYELSKNDIEVDIFDADSQTGGIAGVTYVDNIPIEKYYHHFFKSDKHILQLIKELRIYDKVKWLPSSMGFFVDNKLYKFGTPISLLGFKPLSYWNKFKFGFGILKIMGIKDWRELEQISAHNWLTDNVGSGVYEKVWKPLLTSKFGERYKDISMSWFWGKIKLRGSSKEAGKEVLGYIDGSMKTLLDELEKQLTERRAKLRLNCKVNCIDKNTDGFVLKTSWGDFEYDKIICTTSLPIFTEMARGILPQEYTIEKSKIEYTSVACTIFLLNRPFSKYYWINIGDESVPFGGIIEHTNMLDKNDYNDNNILYISNYLFRSSKYYTMEENELVKEYMEHLKKINPEFDEGWIKSSMTFKDAYAQPIIPLGYSNIKPEYKTPVEGLYTVSMSSIYPEDRGVNYAVREGMNAAKELIK